MRSDLPCRGCCSGAGAVGNQSRCVLFLLVQNVPGPQLCAYVFVCVCSVYSMGRGDELFVQWNTLEDLFVLWAATELPFFQS